MRALHFIDTTGPGGAERIFLDVATGMRTLGWDPHTIVVGEGWVLDSVRRAALPFDLLRTHGRLDVHFLKQLCQVVKSQRIDVIHSHLLSPSVYASAVGLLTNTPVVATMHGESDISPVQWPRRAKYGLVRNRSAIVCVSESLRNRLCSSGLARGSNVLVIPNGIDGEAMAGEGRCVRIEQRIPDGAILIGALGNIRPAKDYGTFIRAAALLSTDPRYYFAIAGEPQEPLYSELCALREAFGLQDRLSFWGFRNDVPDVLDSFDALFISSSSEGFSLAAVQAMVSGTPVIATRSGGPEEIVEDGVSGLLVPTRSPDAAAAAVRRLFSEPGLADSLTRSASAAAKERYSLQAMLRAYDALYNDVTEKRRG